MTASRSRIKHKERPEMHQDGLGYAAVTNNISFILMLLLCIRMGLLDCSDWKIILESHAKTINCFKLKMIHTTSSDISLSKQIKRPIETSRSGES